MSGLLFGKSSHRRDSEGLYEPIGSFLQLAFLMISAPSGKWQRAKGDRWNCFHNLFKYVVDFSSPFKPSPAAPTLACQKQEDVCFSLSFMLGSVFCKDKTHFRAVQYMGVLLNIYPAFFDFHRQNVKERDQCLGMYSRHIYCHSMTSSGGGQQVVLLAQTQMGHLIHQL